MDNTRLRMMLTRHEGRKNRVYKDTEGLLTVGIGHLLTPRDGDLQMGDIVNEHEIENWFTRDLNMAILRAENIVGKELFRSLDEVRQEVLVNMSFNIANRLDKFTKFLEALREHDYVRASDEMMDSRWATQVKGRAVELANAMKNGYFSD